MSNGSNNFGVGYSEIVFFEKTLKSHVSVASFKRTHDIRFEIKRKQGMSTLIVVLVSEYMLGEAFAYEVLNQFEDTNIIVNNGNWNMVIVDRKEFMKNTGVDVLKLNQFLGALNNPATGQ